MAKNRETVPVTPDSFGAGGPFDILNMAQVRVAGVGGAALLFVVAVVALQYQVTRLSLAAGLGGGAIIARLIFRYHRRHLHEHPGSDVLTDALVGHAEDLAARNAKR